MKKEAQDKEIPIGVKIISILYYIDAGLLLLQGIVTFILAISGTSILGFNKLGIIIYGLGTLSIVFSVLFAFIAKSLWKGKNWAKILIIIFSILVILGSFPLIFGVEIFIGIFIMVIHGFMGGYLLFSSKAKDFFNVKSEKDIEQIKQTPKEIKKPLPSTVQKKDVWDLSNKKWLYWTGVSGFVLTFQLYLWLIAVILYFTCDKGKPKTENYQIGKVYEKFMIVVGNLGLVVLLILLILLTLGIIDFTSLY